MNDQGDGEFHKLRSKLYFLKFTAAKKAFLKEYMGVMKPVIQALNILQSEAKMFMGYLLPMITILQEKLNSQEATVTVCRPLVNALLSAINRRFKDIFCNKEAIAAAIVHLSLEPAGQISKL